MREKPTGRPIVDRWSEIPDGYLRRVFCRRRGSQMEWTLFRTATTPVEFRVCFWSRHVWSSEDAKAIGCEGYTFEDAKAIGCEGYTFLQIASATRLFGSGYGEAMNLEDMA